ncbi:MAG: cold shock CspA family protein [Myxococcota bacterium]|jgi:cold shock CspA family protein
MTPGPRLGRIIKLFAESGYGFIRSENGIVAFFDADDLAQSEITSLQVGGRVRFELLAQGIPRATRVMVA